LYDHIDVLGAFLRKAAPVRGQAQAVSHGQDLYQLRSARSVHQVDPRIRLERASHGRGGRFRISLQPAVFGGRKDLHRRQQCGVLQYFDKSQIHRFFPPEGAPKIRWGAAS
jgi:hypothetical protein